MIGTQGNWGQPKLTHHTLAAHMGMRRFMAIKAVEEQRDRSWDIGTVGMPSTLRHREKIQEVPLFSAVRTDTGRALFDFSSSD